MVSITNILTLSKSKVRFVNKLTMIMILALGLLSSQMSVAQTGTFLKGTVVEKETGKPLPKASVSVQALRLGAVTDSKGNFTFVVPAGTHNVEAKYIGYSVISHRVTIKDGETKTLRFEMSSQMIETNQIVVIGLTGEVDRNQIGNSIGSVSSKEIANVVSPSAIDAISGRVTGVQVTKNSGTPGAGTFITIRGRKTISGGSEPLYIVDGVLIDNTTLYDGSGTKQYANRAVDINPADIESMEILKGASAAAIYGSQAANGVILITTKRGKLTSSDKPAQISYNSSMTFDNKAGEVPLQTSYGQTTPWTEGKPGTSTSYGKKLADGVPTFNNADAPFRNAVSHQQSLTISGGVPQFDYMINGTFDGIQGYVNNSTLDRTSLRANIGASVLPGLSIKTNNNFIMSTNSLPQDGSNTSGILLGSLRTPPEFDNKISTYADGTQRRFASYDNPIWSQNNNKYSTDIQRFIHGTTLKFQPVEYLNFSTTFGVDNYNLSNKERLAVGSATSNSRLGAINSSRATSSQMNLDFGANFQDRFLDDQLLLNFQIGSQIIWAERTAIGISGITTLPFFDEINAAASKDASSSYAKSKTVGIFGQLSTTWQDRLTLTGAVRRDGSSTFGESTQFHYYPKFSMSYVMSKEEYWQSLSSTFNSFRIRGSWGEAGSPSLPGAYATNFLYGTSGFFDPWDRAVSAGRLGQSGIRQGGGASDASIGAGNNDIKPERTSEYEFGFDFGILSDMITFEFTYYNQNITDMILALSLPVSTGYDYQLRNAAEMTNKGYEIGVKATPFNTSTFSWSTAINYSSNVNEVTKLEGSKFINLTGGFSGMTNIAMVGQPLGVFYGYGWLKDVQGKVVYSGDWVVGDENGAMVRDANGKVTKTTKDVKNAIEMGDDYGNPYTGTPIQDANLQILGNSNPDFQMSWRNDFTVMQDFTIGFLFDAVFGFDVWNGTKGALFNFGTAGETADRDTPWFNFDGTPVKDATGAQVTKISYYRQYANGFNINEPHVQDGSFIKLREVSLSYRWQGLQEWNINSVVFTFAARNLLTITDYTGYDPEVNTFSAAEGRGYDYFTLPQIQSYRFGIQVNY